MSRPNKRAGWNFLEKKLSKQDLIREQSGKFEKMINRKVTFLFKLSDNWAVWGLFMLEL